MNYKIKLYLIGLLSGVLLALAFPPLPFYFLAFIGFIPLLFVLEEKKGEKSFLLLYSTFFLYHSITNWWIGSWQPNADPFLMASGIILSFFHPLFFLVPIYTYLFVRKKFGLNTALWLFPFIWTSFEWLHSLGEMSYPWLTIGYTQVYNSLWVQVADISGIWGVSFLIVMINSLFTKIFFSIRTCDSGISICLKEKKTLKILIINILLLLSPYFYGLVRVNEYNHSDIVKKNKYIKIGIIQPNINPWAKWERNVLGQISEHIRLQDSLLITHPDIDLFLWSETAIPFLDLNLNSSHNFGALKNWIDKHQISILTGLADIKLYRTNEEVPATVKKIEGAQTMYYESYNSALILNPYYKNPSELQIYNKMRLTPFSERFPYGKYLSFATDWFKWGVGISSWNTGESQFPLILKKTLNSVNDIPIGAIICIESIYPDFSKEYIRQGAELLVVITNDAWFNHTFGPEQHFIMSRVRAIETRRYIARCANSGLSGFIAPSGESVKLLKQYTVTADAERVPLMKEKTIYVKFGDWLVYLCTTISFIFIIFGMIVKKK